MASLTKPRSKAKMKADGAAAATMTDEQADALIGECGTAMNALDRIEAEMNEELAAVKAKYEQRAEPHKAAVVDTYARLTVWGIAHRKRLTNDGETKTVRMPCGELLWRARPASVQLKRGTKEEDVVAQAQEFKFGRLLRVTFALNKQAMLAEPEVAQQLDGVVIRSAGETFDVVPFGTKLSEKKP